MARRADDLLNPEIERQVMAVGVGEVRTQVLGVALSQHVSVDGALFGEEAHVVDVLGAVARELGEQQVLGG